jgi:protein TonB
MRLRKYPEADLRRTYGKVLWICVGLSAFVHFFILVVYPSFEVKAYAKSQEPVIIQLEQIPETKQQRRPPPPPRPVVPIVSDNPDVPDDATIEITDFDFLADLAPPPALALEVEIEIEEEEAEYAELWMLEQKPVPTRRVDPEYPRRARELKIEGTVVVEMYLNEQGKVDSVRVISGNRLFHEVTKEAAVQWEFTPAMQNDRPVRLKVAVPFSFVFR